MKSYQSLKKTNKLTQLNNRFLLSYAPIAIIIMPEEHASGFELKTCFSIYRQ
jgi:hypothetical protein